MRRCISMRVLLVFAALLISSSGFAQSRSARICYFSLNNEKEFVETQKLAQKLNQATGSNITVKEFMPKGGNPNEAFRKMVASGEKCDGLVISGHHYGAWEGNRANGKLKLDFIEKLSCDPRYKEWFKNINSLHLQGCRTLGVGEIVSDDPAYSADANTARVNRHVLEDNTREDVEAGVQELNHEFTNTLDQENPLSSRYLRTFPRATTFGWTKSAPGEESKSELSLLYHIAHMADVNNYHHRGIIVDPLKNLSNTDAAELANAALDMLQKPDWDDCEVKSITAWKRHGTLIKNKGLGYNNPDLNAYKSYESTNTPQMVRLKEIGCKLKNAKNQSDRMAAVREIIKDRASIAANFNSLVEMASSRSMSSQEKNQIIDLMGSSDALRSFVGDKFNTKNNALVGMFAKLDYYSFYKKVFKQKSPDAERLITQETFKVLLKPYPNKSETSAEYLDLRDFKSTLTSALAKNGFVDDKFMNQLLNNSSPMAQKMYKEIYNKMYAASVRDPSLYEMKQLVQRLKPTADTIR